MSGKSTGRHALKSLFPDAFVKGRKAIHDADVVGEDSLQILRCITDKEVTPDPTNGDLKIANGRALAIIAKRSAEHYLNKRDCTYYMMCLDNAFFVPMTKGEEQASRDEKEKKRRKYDERGVVPYYELEQPCIDLDQPLPQDWDLALSDREGFRMDTISWLCSQWLMSDDPEVRVSVPPGKHLMLNGHCLTVEQLRAIGIEADPGHDPRNCPIIVTGGCGAEIDTIWTDPMFENRSGEAEFQFFFLFDRICELEKSRLSLDVISTDTDVMYITSLHADKHYNDRERGRISWKFAPRGGWVLYRDDPAEDEEERVLVNKLRDDIVSANFCPIFKPVVKEPQRKRKAESEASSIPTKKSKSLAGNAIPVSASDLERWKTGIKNLKQPVWAIVATAVIAGCDYTTSYHGLTHHRFFEALFTYSHYIGDLIEVSDDFDGGIQLDGGAYFRLVKTAYILSKPRLGKENPECTTLAKIRELTETGKKKFTEKNQLPPNGTIKNRALHALHYLKLLFQFDRRELNEPDPAGYAYGPEDPSKVMSRLNIIRLQ